jgi:hypothetical protein
MESKRAVRVEAPSRRRSEHLRGGRGPVKGEWPRVREMHLRESVVLHRAYVTSGGEGAESGRKLGERR